MAKITKGQIKEYVRTKLSTDPTWAKRALLKIFEFQTDEEQEYESTHDHNGVGFTGVDGEILASFAKQLQRRGDLSPKQMDLLFKKMPKYWRQIISISDSEKLLTLIERV
ncbi:MAG TPA: hypothetical protein VMX17_06545 [Candidatus Glassbacteria bacterium]|nr:hypothetical protein [Candidatus Glassbacteria bacterium]